MLDIQEPVDPHYWTGLERASNPAPIQSNNITVNDYGVASKVGYFMMDNADNNDTMMEALSNCKYEQLIGYKTGFLSIYNL
jgi:hypothetical protein